MGSPSTGFFIRQDGFNSKMIRLVIRTDLKVGSLRSVPSVEDRLPTGPYTFSAVACVGKCSYLFVAFQYF